MFKKAMANDISDEKKQTAFFLMVIGTKTYRLLHNLFTPVKPSTKNIKALYQKLRENIKPQLIVISQR